ncbi:MAG: dadA [Planctomycetaceae bacterium]|nr:dadA [Planctomycetaceae bacterium]
MSKHVLIVGGGVIGLCSAYYCLERGWRVTVVERNPCERDGCSYGNAGMIVPSHFVPLAAPGMVALGMKWMWNPESPFYIQPRFSWDLFSWSYKFWRACSSKRVDQAAPLLRDLHFASRACYERLSDEWSNEFGLVRKGLLMLCNTEHGLEEEARGAEKARQLGIPADVLDASATAALDPGAKMEICGAVHYPRDAHLVPQRFVNGLQKRLIERGCQFQWESEVTGFEQRGRRIAAVQTTHGIVEADEIVIASGMWSTGLARLLRLNLPMQAGKGYSLTLPKPRQLPQLCSILTEARAAVAPMGETLRFGGTMEMSGLNETIRPARVRGIIKSAIRYFPEFRPEDFDGIPPWRGLRPCSPDGLPYLGRTERFENLIVATGHAMMGVSLGPASGQIVSNLVSHESPGFDLRLLSPDRYA